MFMLTVREKPTRHGAELDIAAMRLGAGRATAMLRTLAHGDRLLLLCQLTHGEQCVSDLEALLDIHQPTLSQQLAVLRNEGLVATRREGKHIHYRVSDPAVLELLKTLHSLYCPKPRKRRPAVLRADIS